MRDDSTGAAGATIELLQELIRNACGCRRRSTKTSPGTCSGR